MPSDVGLLGLAQEFRYDSERQQKLVENVKTESEIPFFSFKVILPSE